MKLSLFSIRHFLRKLNRLPDAIKRYVSGRLLGTNDSFETFEVDTIRRDIEVLRTGKSMTRYERGQDWFYQMVRERYGGTYCPQDVHHEELSWENQQRYLWLRLEIDKALDDSLYIYND